MIKIITKKGVRFGTYFCLGKPKYFEFGGDIINVDDVIDYQKRVKDLNLDDLFALGCSFSNDKKYILDKNSVRYEMNDFISIKSIVKELYTLD